MPFCASAATFIAVGLASKPWETRLSSTQRLMMAAMTLEELDGSTSGMVLADSLRWYELR